MSLKTILSFSVVLLTMTSCRKYLSRIPDQSLIIPSSVEDYRNLLDNDLMTQNATPGLGPLGVDDYFVSYNNWLALAPPMNTAYDWQEDIFEGQPSFSWDNPYQAIYYANVVLGEIGSLTVPSSKLAEYNAVRGSALFYRAFHNYNLEETFGQPYSPSTAATAVGIPLRLSENPDQADTRASVKTVFQQIVADLQQAIPLLPSGVQWSNRNRPCQPAAYALLARTYLTMQNYADAEANADSSLGLYDGLVDYNTVDSAKAHPFPASGNNEVLFQCSAFNYQVLYDFSAEADTNLYRSYDPNDLRRAVFFRPAPSGDGGVCFKGNYTGQIYVFSGLATDEVFLIRAECRARRGDIAGALADLDTLMTARFRQGTFIPFSGTTATQALTEVLTERRKETLFRELRWADLRRLNQDPRFEVGIVRLLGGAKDSLPPLDERYTYPIPPDEILIGGIQQNPR
jgi:hypothetical protein